MWKRKEAEPLPWGYSRFLWGMLSQGLLIFKLYIAILEPWRRRWLTPVRRLRSPNSLETKHGYALFR